MRMLQAGTGSCLLRGANEKEKGRDESGGVKPLSQVARRSSFQTRYDALTVYFESAASATFVSQKS